MWRAFCVLPRSLVYKVPWCCFETELDWNIPCFCDPPVMDKRCLWADTGALLSDPRILLNSTLFILGAGRLTWSEPCDGDEMVKGGGFRPLLWMWSNFNVSDTSGLLEFSILGLIYEWGLPAVLTELLSEVLTYWAEVFEALEERREEITCGRWNISETLLRWSWWWRWGKCWSVEINEDGDPLTDEFVVIANLGLRCWFNSKRNRACFGKMQMAHVWMSIGKNTEWLNFFSSNRRTNSFQ